MEKAGREVSPVEIAGRKIAATFWGDAWCRNLESYSDYSNRLPRGRTYVRNGSVIDLQIKAGRVRSLVSGSDLYEVDIKIKPLAKRRWTRIKRRCAGQIDSLVELLQGTISKGVMEIVTRKGEGLFPSPREISLNCSCPDWATMCKHVAATLYGVGARLDRVPELLFTLRGVDPVAMVEAAVDQPPPGGKSRRGRVLESAELSSVFGIDMDDTSAEDVPARARRGRRAVRTREKTAKRSTAVNKPAARKSSVKEKAATKKPVTRKKGTTTKRATAKRASGGATRQAKKKTTGKGAASEKKPTPGKSDTKKAGNKAGAKKTPSEKRAPGRKTSSGSAGRATKRSSARRTSGSARY
jgi:uncharacterized Zn finger protein